MTSDFSFLAMTAEERANTDVDLYFLCGQSNADGSSSFDSARPGQRDGNRYENVRYCACRQYVDRHYRYLFEHFGPVHEGLGYKDDQIGPELGMARYLDPLYAGTSRKAVIIKVAIGATRLLARDPGAEQMISAAHVQYFHERGSWYPEAAEEKNPDGTPVSGTDYFRPTGFALRQFRDFSARMYRRLEELQFRSLNIRGLCWMQGESDRTLPAEYASVFPLLCRDFRAHFSALTGHDESLTPIIVGEISESYVNSTPESLAWNREFIAMQNRLPDAVPGVHVIHTGKFQLTRLDENGNRVPLGTDHGHWNYGDMLTIGEMFGQAVYAASAE